MPGATVFSSKLDVSTGYWQIKADEISSSLLGFLLVSIVPAKCKRISEILDSLEGVVHIQEDIIAWGTDRGNRKNNLCKVLEKIKVSGLKFSISLEVK